MMILYTDEQIEKLDSDVCYAICHFSQTIESLNKIIDFIQRRPDLAKNIICIPKEKFMKIDNFTLIEACQHIKYSIDPNINLKIKRAKPKAALKRVLGIYKKHN